MTTSNCLHRFHPMAEQMSTSELMAVWPFLNLFDFASGIFVFNLNPLQQFHPWTPSWFPEIPPTLRTYSGIHGVTLQPYMTQAAWRTSQPVSYIDTQQAPAVWTAWLLSPYTERVLPSKEFRCVLLPRFWPHASLLFFVSLFHLFKRPFLNTPFKGALLQRKSVSLFQHHFFLAIRRWKQVVYSPVCIWVYFVGCA